MTAEKRVVFDFKDYKAYLRTILEAKGPGRITRSAVASAVRCHSAYVSQVLNKDLHFSNEQGHRLNEFLRHDYDESRYLLLLIQTARAGTDELRVFLDRQISDLIEARTLLKNRVPQRASLDEKMQSEYYSSWTYGAVHVALSIPRLRSVQAISSHLGLPYARVGEALRFLADCGLAAPAGDHFVPTGRSIHLGRDSHMIARHHANWRLKALEALDHHAADDLHYSGVFSISAGVAASLKEMITRHLREYLEQIGTAADEETMALNIDFFGLGSGRPREVR